MAENDDGDRTVRDRSDPARSLARWVGRRTGAAGRDAGGIDGADGFDGRPAARTRGRGERTTADTGRAIRAVVLAAFLTLAAATAGVPAGGAAPAIVAATNESATNESAPSSVTATKTVTGDDGSTSGSLSTAAVSEPIASCVRIDASGTYEVQSFVADTAGGCIVINASDVTLEGTGFGATITGNDTGAAIEVATTATTVTLEDVAVQNWRQGVEAQGVSDVNVTGLEAKDVMWGVDADGADAATVTATRVRGASVAAVDGRVHGRLAVRNLEATDVQIVITADGVSKTPDDVDVDNVVARDVRLAGLALGGDVSSIDVDGLDVVNATVGVRVRGPPTGTVTNVTLAETPAAVTAVDGGSGVRFEDVDLATPPFFVSTGQEATVTFTVANGSVGTVQSAPSPRIPTGQANGTGPVFVDPNAGSTEFVVDYDPVVAEPFEDTVSTWRYDGGSWGGPAGTTYAGNETVRFTPDGDAVYGVFSEQSPVSSCGEFDAPGRYEVESFSVPDFAGGSCLRVTGDGVTLAGTGGGSTVSGPSGEAVRVAGGVESVRVERLVVSGWTRGVNASGAADATVRDVAVEGTGATAVRARDAGLVALVNVSVHSLADGGTGIDVAGTATPRLFDLRIGEPAGSVASAGGADGTDPGLATGAVAQTPYTAIAAGGPSGTQSLDVRNVVVGDVTRAVAVDAASTVGGQVLNLTARNVREVVAVDGSGAGTLRFDRIDTGTATASFTAADAVVGPASTAVSPSTPPFTRNATGHLNVTGDGPGAYVEVDYGANVPEAYEDSLATERYDAGQGQWVPAGTQDATNETVRFGVGDASGLYGVFFDAAPLTTCGVLDAPGVYEVGTVDGPVADGDACLTVAAEDVTLRGTAGATVTGNGSGTGVELVRVRGGLIDDVTVRNLAVERYGTAVDDEGATSSVTVEGVRLADSSRGLRSELGTTVVGNTTVVNTSSRGLLFEQIAEVRLRNVTVRRPAPVGVSADFVTQLTVDGLAVADAAAGTVSGSPTPGTGLVVSDTEETDVRNVTVRNATRGVTLAAPSAGTIRGVSTTAVDEAIYTEQNNSRATVRDLATAEGRATIVGPENVSVSPSAVAGTPTDRPVRLGVVNVTGTAATPRTDLSFAFDPAAVDAADLSVYQYDPGTDRWSAVTGSGAVDEADGTVTATVSPADGSTEVYGAFSTARDTTAPVAEAGPDRTVQPNETLTFDAGNSTDDTVIASYGWELGDGTTATGERVTHSYASEGTYRVNLTVADGAGNTDTDSLTVTVGPACPVVDGVRTTDTTGDGLCEDVDGNGKFEFFDVVALLFVDPGPLTSAETATFDFDGDGRFGFLDVVTLLFEL